MVVCLVLLGARTFYDIQLWANEREVTPPSHYTEGEMGNNEGFNETFIRAPNLHPSKIARLKTLFKS